MSVNRPQTASLVFAILTLFAAAAWGQQKGADIPVYESDNAIFGADELPSTDLFQKTSLETEIESQAETAKSDANQGYAAIDSMFGPSTKPMVNKDGYFIPAADGEIWKEFTTRQTSSARVANLKTTKTAKTKQDGQPDTNVGPVLSIPVDAEAEPQTTLFNSTAPSKLRLRIGFDILKFERGRAENTIFATEDNGSEWAFSDFDLSKGDARYFVQFMGDDQSGFELTFYDFKSFSSSINATGDNVEPLFFQGLPASQTRTYDLNYTSRLKNIELNSWIRHDERHRSGYGLRHINLDESFDVLSGGNALTGLYSRTNNDLWGLTRMWERRRPLLNRMTLKGGVDAGLYLNRAKLNVDTLNIDDASEAKNIAGTLGFDLGVEYLVADHVTLRFGYEGLGIFGVALGSTQSLEQNIFNGLNDPEPGSIFFGGFYFGAIAAF